MASVRDAAQPRFHIGALWPGTWQHLGRRPKTQRDVPRISSLASAAVANVTLGPPGR